MCSARHSSMTKLCSAFFKCENKQKNWLRKLMHSFEGHSNESTCRKSGRLGLEQVPYKIQDIPFLLDISGVFEMVAIYPSIGMFML